MPIFRDLRDTRGRFVSHQATGQLEAALDRFTQTHDPVAWERFHQLANQILGKDAFSLLRSQGSNIPFLPQGRGAPPQSSPFSPGRGGFGFGSDPDSKRMFHEMEKRLRHIDDIQTQYIRSISIPRWPTQAQMAGAPGMGPWGARGPGGTVPAFPGFPGGGFVGGGGGRPPNVFVLPAGGGGVPRGGGGFPGGGFGGVPAGGGGRLLAAALPPNMRGLVTGAGEAFGIFELVKFLLNPVAAASNMVVQGLAQASRPSWDFRRLGFGLVGPGGDAQDFMEAIAPSTRHIPGFPGVHDPRLPLWMRQLGMGPMDAENLMQTFGIPGRTPGENIRNLQMLGVAGLGATDRFEGFRGMDPNQIAGFARTAMARGVGGGAELADTTFLQRLSDTMKIAVAEGADRASIFEKMQSSLQMLSRAGVSGIDMGAISRLFDQMVLSGLPGGRTGEAALSMLGGEAAAAQTLGTDPRRTLIGAGLYSRYGGDLEKMLGADVMGKLNPTQAKLLEQAKDLARRGAVLPAMQLMGDILGGFPERWGELATEGAKLFMPGIPGMQTLFGAGAAGVGRPEFVGRGLARSVGMATVRGGMAEKMWGWLKSHGYSDEAASAVIANATQESALVPWGNVGPGGDQGLFQFSPRGELPGYLAWAQSQGKDPKDWETQMEFMDLRTGKLIPGFRTTTDPNAAAMFERGFERPASLADAGTREAIARSVRSTFAGTSITQPGDTGLPTQFGNLIPGIPTDVLSSQAMSQSTALAASAGWADQFGDSIGRSVTSVSNFAEQLVRDTTLLERFGDIILKLIQAGQNTLGITPVSPNPVVTPGTVGP